MLTTRDKLRRRTNKEKINYLNQLTNHKEVVIIKLTILQQIVVVIKKRKRR